MFLQERDKRAYRETKTEVEKWITANGLVENGRIVEA